MILAARFKIGIGLILIAFLLLPAASCGTVPITASPWTADNLRLLDPAGDSPSPATDILAVYTRTAGTDFEIRLDLLDIPITPDYNLILYLDPSPSNSDPADWQIEASIPAQGSPTVFTRNPGLDASKIIPRVIRDPWLDTVVVRFNQHHLPQDFKLTVLTIHSLPNQVNLPDDVAANIFLNGKPPAARASVLLAFTNTFPVATPAQALRRWDGAHTGPTGERHGLRLILDGVRANNLPVALLDLKTPSSLAALDFLGALDDVRVISKKGLLILPAVAQGEPADIALGLSRRTAKGFHLPSSDFVTAPDFVPGARYQFISLPDTTHISLSDSTRLIPLPPTDTIPQATMDGPSLEVRRALMDAALSADKIQFLLLGGSLPDSTWGQADRAAPTFAWLAAHPWIHVLDENDLMTFPVGPGDQPHEDTTIKNTFLDALQDAPKNAITDSAWQTVLMLTRPTDELSLHELQLNYLNQVNTLLVASHWADLPFTQYDCAIDLDLDLRQECVLANGNYFAVIETNGARLTHLFHGEHQLVGPTAQFTIGLSDPSEWNKIPGDGADPGQIMGAFTDETDPFQEYAASWSEPDTLTLISADGSRVKIYRLTRDGLEVSEQSSGPSGTKIPLAVDPQIFFSGSSNYTAAESAGAWTWGTANGIRVRVRTEAAISAISFTDSLPFLGLPEDPNVDYPPGHYLPFPLSLITLHSDGSFRVQIDAVR